MYLYFGIAHLFWSRSPFYVLNLIVEYLLKTVCNIVIHIDLTSWDVKVYLNQCNSAINMQIDALIRYDQFKIHIFEMVI